MSTELREALICVCAGVVIAFLIVLFAMAVSVLA